MHENIFSSLHSIFEEDITTSRRQPKEASVKKSNGPGYDDIMWLRFRNVALLLPTYVFWAFTPGQWFMFEVDPCCSCSVVDLKGDRKPEITAADLSDRLLHNLFLKEKGHGHFSPLSVFILY